MSYQQISIEDLYNLMKSDKKLMILDVRSEEEFEGTRIPGSYNIPLPMLTIEKMDNLMTEKGFSKKDPIYVTCAVGPRAVSACEIIENDFPNVYHLVGCVNAWVEEELPTESGEVN